MNPSTKIPKHSSSQNQLLVTSSTLAIHMLTLKEMCNYLEELHSGKNNINRAFDIIHEMFRSEKGNKTLSQHYANFNMVYEELKVLSFILQDVKMQKQWDQLAVLTFVGSLSLEYTSARPHVIGSSAVDFLSKIYRFLQSVFPTESCWERVP